MTKQAAVELWKQILAFKTASEEVGGEGNSGEFYDEQEEKRVIEEFEKAFFNIREAFIAATGYIPIIRANGKAMHFLGWNGLFHEARNAQGDYANIYRKQYDKPAEGAISPSAIFPLPKGVWEFIPITDKGFTIHLNLPLARAKSEHLWEFPIGEITF